MGCPPRVVRGSALQAAIASGVNQTVRLPRARRPASYAAQLMTRCCCFGMWRRQAALALNGTAGIQASGKGPSSYTAQLPTPTGRSMQQGGRRGFQTAETKRLCARVEAGTTIVSDGGQWFRCIAYQPGIIHERHVTGSDRTAARHPAFRWANTVLANVKNSLLATHRAVAAKHLPRSTSPPPRPRQCPIPSSNWLRLDGERELSYRCTDNPLFK